MGSIIRVESCHDLPVQDSGVGVKFCEFVGNTLVCWYMYMRNKIGLHPYYYWPTFGRGVGELAHLRKSCSVYFFWHLLIMVIVVNIWKS